MNVLILGAAGFIGTNLALTIAENVTDSVVAVDVNKNYFSVLEQKSMKNIRFVEEKYDMNVKFDSLLDGVDVVYHLASTTIPTISNQHIPDELTANVVVTARLLDACVRCNVKKVVFISSGGTVYGKEANCPLKENTPTNPISAYGVQKITIEKLLYLYNYMYGLDYRIIRLANPYGPYQRPNGMLGAVTTFTYKALKGEPITVFGDGSVVRDFIYIDDVIRAIGNIVSGDNKHKTFNLGCGYGTSIAELLEIIEVALNVKLEIENLPSRKVDVPVNYLDISRYEKAYGKLNPIGLKDGIYKTAEFLKNNYL